MIMIKSGKKELREFGLSVGIVLLVLGGVLVWAGKPSYPYFLGAGSFLVFSGLSFPFVLEPLHKAWMALAHVMGWVMTHVLLSLFYYLVLTPIAVLGRIAGKEFLDRKIHASKDTYWNKRELVQDLRSRYERQY